jgi:hypothetical protein
MGSISIEMRRAFCVVPCPMTAQFVQDGSVKVFHKSAWNIIRMMKFRADDGAEKLLQSFD